MSIKKTILILFSLLLSACMTLPSVPIQVHVDASKRLNPDPSFVSLPVRLKIYQLSDVTLFNEATFRQLWKSDVVTLGSTLLDKKELTINPGENQTFKMARLPQAEYIAVVGVFRRHEDNGWKAVKRLPGQVHSLVKQLFVVAKGHRVEIK